MRRRLRSLTRTEQRRLTSRVRRIGDHAVSTDTGLARQTREQGRPWPTDPGPIARDPAELPFGELKHHDPEACQGNEVAWGVPTGL